MQYNRHTCALPVHVMILVQCVRFVLNAKMAGVIIQRSCEYSLLLSVQICPLYRTMCLKSGLHNSNVRSAVMECMAHR